LSSELLQPRWWWSIHRIQKQIIVYPGTKGQINQHQSKEEKVTGCNLFQQEHSEQLQSSSSQGRMGRKGKGLVTKFCGNVGS
jgi:hypothetical protein